jgi:vancomycin resistance protein YoaR
VTTGSTSWLDDPPDDRPDDEVRDRSRRRRDRRILIGVTLVVLALVGGVYFAGHVLASDRLPRATTVAGIEVGGLTPRDAQSELRRRLAEVQDDPVVVEAADQEFRLSPQEAGLEVDVAASIQQVPVGQSWSPADIWESFVGGEDYPAVVLTIDDLLVRSLEEVAAEVDEPPVEGAVEFRRSGAEPVYPETGRRLDVDAAVEAVTAAYPTSEVVPLRLRADRSEVSAGAVSDAMREFANPAMSAPVVYRFGREEVTLTPARFAPALSMEAVDGELQPQVDRKRLLAAFGPAARTVAEEPQDATVRIVDGEPEVVPAKNGATIDRDRIVDSFLDLVVADGSDRELEMDPELVRPEVTTREARSWGIEEEVSEFTTYYPHADYRNTNIGRAAELIDGTVLAPGETFSMNETVGERTEANGFTEGFIISDGVFREELGGGVSQVATTTYNAAYFAGLEDVEHKAHSFYIDRYPVGREATLVWPVVDLKFKNDTDHGVLIQTQHSPSGPGGTGSVTVRMWSTKVWDVESVTGGRYNLTSPDTRYSDDEDCYPNEGYGGFTIDVTRVFREAGSSEVARRETVTTVYTPSDTVICQ